MKLKKFCRKAIVLKYDKRSIQMNYNLNHRICWVGGNSAVIVLVSSHVNISIHAPIGIPAVLQNPVILIGCRISAIANQKHGMVCSSGGAFRIVKNPTLIQLKVVATSIDSY